MIPAVVGVVAALVVVLGLAAWFLSRPSQNAQAERARGSASAAQSSPDPATTVTEAGPTVTATVTESSAATPDSGSGGGRPRPASWPAYVYGGPSDYDVCLQPGLPVGSDLTEGARPDPGTPEYWTLRSAQAALRSLNYGKPGPVVSDGFLGPLTAAALASFQRSKGVAETGALDMSTWAELNRWVHVWDDVCPS